MRRQGGWKAGQRTVSCLRCSNFEAIRKHKTRSRRLGFDGKTDSPRWTGTWAGANMHPSTSGLGFGPPVLMQSLRVLRTQRGAGVGGCPLSWAGGCAGQGGVAHPQMRCWGTCVWGCKGSVRPPPRPPGVHTTLGLYHQRSYSLVACACGLQPGFKLTARNERMPLRNWGLLSQSHLDPGGSRFLSVASASLFPVLSQLKSFHGALGLGWGESPRGGSWGDGLQANEATWWLVLPGLGRGEARGCPLNMAAACPGVCRP